MVRGVFITFEGCDGSGKSTQMKLIRERLEDAGIDVLVTREPGGTEFGELVRRVLLDSSGPDRTSLAELFLYAASRAEIVHKVIMPALERGQVVLTERFADSTTVYQGYAGGIPVEDVETINNVATCGLVPDLTFVLDVNDPQVFHDRLAPKSKDKIEMRDDRYHAKVREGYRQLARNHPERVRLIDATLPPQDVLAIVEDTVWKVLRNKKGGRAQ
jgi:dTMP kinase